jgi:peptidoglycan/LPS O-acetylase OafA/YrhL
VLALVSAGVLIAAAFVAPAMSLALPIAGTYLFFFLAFEQRLGISGWGRYGDFSYGVYLYGFPVQQTIVAMLGGKIQPLVLFPAALCGTTVLAVMSWYLIERPCLQFARSGRPAVREIPKAHSVPVTTPIQPVQRG